MTMLNHVTIGVTDLDRATQFYDEHLGIIGAKELWSTPGMRMLWLQSRLTQSSGLHSF